MTGLSIPGLPLSCTLTEAAQLYAAAGWYVLPVDPGGKGKHPGSLVGSGWQYQSSRDPGQIAQWWQWWPGASLALHTGRSGAVAFDADSPAHMPAVLRTYQDAMAFQSTRSNDPERGHYLAACEPMEFGASLGDLRTEPKWGEIRSGNSVIIAEPSAHPKAGQGGRYKWLRRELPRVPAELAACLRPPGAPGADRGDTELPGDDGRCPLVLAWLEGRDFRGADPRGDRANAAVNYLKRMDAEGHHIGGWIDEVTAALPSTSEADFEGMWATAPVPAGIITIPHDCCTRPPFSAQRAEVAQANGSATSAPGLPPSQGSPLNLPAEFWKARPVLGDIRMGAWSRGRPADTVLHAVLARVASMCPPWLSVDPKGDGETISLGTFFAVLAGGPSAGKSASSRIAGALLPELAWYRGLSTVPGQLNDHQPLGSGEGIAEAYMGVLEETDDKGKPKYVRRQVRHHAYFYCDEGAQLAKLLERSGATIGETLRRAWSGSTLGQANASVDRTRIIPEGSYSIGLVISFQPSTAGPLLADASAGTPQRFTYALAAEPALPPVRPAWPGTLDLKWPDLVNTGETWGAGRLVMPFAAEVQQEIRGRADAVTRGERQVALLDGHADLTQAKMAALLAALDGRHEVTVEDWQLAGVAWQVSCSVRDWLVSYGHEEARQAEAGIRVKLAGRKVAETEALDEYAMGQAVRSVARRIHRDRDTGRCPDGCLRTCLTQSIKGDVRRQVSLDEVISQAITQGYAEADGDRFRPGRIKP